MSLVDGGDTFILTQVACAGTNAHCVNTKNPSEYTRTQILADTMVFNQEDLPHPVAVLGGNLIELPWLTG